MFKRRNNDKVRQMDTIEAATKLLSDVGILNYRNAEITILVEIFQVSGPPPLQHHHFTAKRSADAGFSLFPRVGRGRAGWL